MQDYKLTDTLQRNYNLKYFFFRTFEQHCFGCQLQCLLRQMSVLCVCPISSIHTKYSFYIFIHTANASAIDTENIHTCRIKKTVKTIRKKEENYEAEVTLTHTLTNSIIHFISREIACIYISYIHIYIQYMIARAT